MDDAVLVHVIEGIADAESDLDCPLDGKLLFFVEDGTEQATVDPLDHHVGPAALFVVEGLHNAGVIEELTYLLLTIESLEQDRIRFHLGKRNFDGYEAASV